MDSPNNYNKNRKLSFVAALLISAVALLGLQACGGGGGSTPEPVVDAKPAGYYSSGAATVNDPADAANNLIISDLQAMVNGNRFMMMSLSNALMYDATITSISGNDFTADVTIYYNMSIDQITMPDAVINTTITGTITEGAQITGTIVGSGIGSGDFSLTYSQNNDEQSALSAVAKSWQGPINTLGQSPGFEFSVDDAGVIEVDFLDRPTEGVFNSCVMTGTVSVVDNTRLYSLAINLTEGGCNSAAAVFESNYTGLATTLSQVNADDTLVVMFTNGVIAGMAEWAIATSP